MDKAVVLVLSMVMAPPKALELCGEIVYTMLHESEPTKREMVAVSVKVPEVPVTVTVAAPVVAVLLAVKVSTLLPVVGFVPSVAVTPAGTPETARLTLPVNPFRSATEIVSVAVLLWVTETLEADGESVNPGAVEADATKVVMLCAGSE